jgi:uncharacterized membrane protein YbhN (UPF0104 family)
LNATLKKIALLAAKIGLSVALLGYLFYSASQKPGFWEMVYGQKEWARLVLAWQIVFVTVVITTLRWRLLVQTLGMELSLRDATRIGFLGYAVNLLPLGLVGGDGLKAVFLARQNPTRRTEAVATVVVDRALGLIALLFLAAVGTCFLRVDEMGFETLAARQKVSAMCRVIQILALGGGAGLVLLFVPGVTTSPLWNVLARIPVVGGVIRKLVDAMHIYRGRADRIAIALATSLVIHTLYALMVYFVGAALLGPNGELTAEPPTLKDHFIFVPIAMSAGALPIGAFEWTLDLLYDSFSPGGAAAAADKGFLIAIVYRVIQILVAGTGVAYYLSTRGAPVIVDKEEALQEGLLPRTANSAG